MSQGLHSMVQIAIALVALAVLVWSEETSDRVDLGGSSGEDLDRIDAPRFVGEDLHGGMPR